MKKNLRNIIFGVLLGIIISGTVVYASGILASTITYDNTNSGLKDSNNEDVTNVQTAIDVLLDTAENVNSISKRVCTYVSEGSFGQEGQIGAKYECNPGDGVKRNFYILTVRGNSVDLIMDRNITQGTSKTKYTWKDAVKYFRQGEGLSIKNSWVNVLNVDLPSAQAIAEALGKTSWNMEDYPAFYMTANDRWLYNYSADCAQYTCDAATSLDTNEAGGYWIKESYDDNTACSSYNCAWFVDAYSSGRLFANVITYEIYGVRPVITVLKSNLY